MPTLGKWLTFFADRADQPGSALLADLTSMLAEHWATGQSPLEDASLAAQLAWIDPPPGMTGLQAALATEDPLRCPPAGPATDPGFDQAILEPLIRNYDRAAQAGSQAGTDRAAAEITTALQGQLEPTWETIWHAIALLRALPETAGASRRWAADRDSFTSFSSYLADGGLPQPRRDHAATAAARLDRLERAQAAYDAERALEDPFILAELRTTGEAFAGEVVSARAVADDHHHSRPDDSPAPFHRPHRRPGAHRARPGADLPHTAKPAGPDRRSAPHRYRCRGRARSHPGNGHPRQAETWRGTSPRGTGQLHARPRLLGPAGLPAGRPDPVDPRRPPCAAAR